MRIPIAPELFKGAKDMVSRALGKEKTPYQIATEPIDLNPSKIDFSRISTGGLGDFDYDIQYASRYDPTSSLDEAIRSHMFVGNYFKSPLREKMKDAPPEIRQNTIKELIARSKEESGEIQNANDLLAKATENLQSALKAVPQTQTLTPEQVEEWARRMHPDLPERHQLSIDTFIKKALMAAAVGGTSFPQVLAQMIGMEDQRNRELDQEALARAAVDANRAGLEFNAERERIAGLNRENENAYKATVEAAGVDVDAARDNRNFTVQQENREIQLDESRKAKAWDAYEKNPNATNAARLRALDPDFAPTEAEVQAAIQRKNTVNVKNAQQEWNDQIKTRIDQFGEVSELEEEELNQMRETIAAAYGVDPGVMIPVRSGKTVKMQALEQRKSEFDQRLTFLEKQHRENLAVKKSNVEIAKRRVAAYEEQVRKGFGMLEVAQFRAELQAHNEYADDFNRENDEQIKKLDVNIRGVEAEIASMKKRAKVGDAKTQAKTAADIAKKSAELDGLYEQRKFLHSQYEDVIDLGNTIFGNVIRSATGSDVIDGRRQEVAIPTPPWTEGDPTGPVRLSGPIGNTGTGTKKTTQKKSSIVQKPPQLPPGWKMEGF